MTPSPRVYVYTCARVWPYPSSYHGHTTKLRVSLRGARMQGLRRHPLHRATVATLPRHSHEVIHAANVGVRRWRRRTWCNCSGCWHQEEGHQRSRGCCRQAAPGQGYNRGALASIVNHGYVIVLSEVNVDGALWGTGVRKGGGQGNTGLTLSGPLFSNLAVAAGEGLPVSGGEPEPARRPMGSTWHHLTTGPHARGALPCER